MAVDLLSTWEMKHELINKRSSRAMAKLKKNSTKKLGVRKERKFKLVYSSEAIGLKRFLLLQHLWDEVTSAARWRWKVRREKKSIGSGQSGTNGSNQPDSAVIESASSIGNEQSSSVAGKKIGTELFPSSRKKKIRNFFRLAGIQIFFVAK